MPTYLLVNLLALRKINVASHLQNDVDIPSEDMIVGFG